MQIAREFDWNYDATYGSSGLVVNLMRVGHAFFEDREAQYDLLIHEFGHHSCSDHLSKDFYRALTKLGARMTVLHWISRRFSMIETQRFLWSFA